MNGQRGSTVFVCRPSASDQHQQQHALSPEISLAPVIDRITDQLISADVEVCVYNYVTQLSDGVQCAATPLTMHAGGVLVVHKPADATVRATIAYLTKTFRIADVIQLGETPGHSAEKPAAVFDDGTRRIYACREGEGVAPEVQAWAEAVGYPVVSLTVTEEDGSLSGDMSSVLFLGTRFALVCLDAFRSEQDQDILLDDLVAANKKVIAISYAQRKHFRSGILEATTHYGEPVVVFSEAFHNSLLPGQTDTLSSFATLLPVSWDEDGPWGAGIHPASFFTAVSLEKIVS